MFTPVELGLERGWPGVVDGDRVIQLAAQTLVSFFTGGGQARHHDSYALADVTFLAPVLVPPSVRMFEDDGSFWFGNPAAIVGPDAVVRHPDSAVELRARVAAVIGRDGTAAGYTLLGDWRARDLRPAKDRDFATSLGPLVVTADELGEEIVLHFDGQEAGRARVEVNWEELLSTASEGTELRPGDVLACPPVVLADALAGVIVEFELDGPGSLRNRVAARGRA